ncbi:MAG TPA: type II secretion system protein [Elusimicrobiales bacterium]|nr:type II secretion system protein [Elusimicrobiales bacterium]
MKKRMGFTLVELIIASLLASFMAVSLVTIYSTANRHIFQNYRSNKVKADVSLAMRAIRNATAQATRIDAPAAGNTSSELAVISNMDQLTSCYPIKSGIPAAWHYFCAVNSGNNKLYYYTGNYGGSCACPGSSCAAPWPPPGGTPNCGVTAGGTLLATYLDSTSVFSRSQNSTTIPAVSDAASVGVRLNSTWTPSAGLAISQRPVDYGLQSIFSISRAGR